MEKPLNKPFNRIKLFFQALGGSLDESFEDNEIEESGESGVQHEVEQLSKLSDPKVSALENKHGKQSITVERDGHEEKDRLGYKKTKITNNRHPKDRQDRSIAAKNSSLDDREI